MVTFHVSQAITCTQKYARVRIFPLPSNLMLHKIQTGHLEHFEVELH